MGDFNAKVGEENTGCEQILRGHGIEINENGDIFTNWYAEK
jgi:hypothetical protein